MSHYDDFSEERIERMREFTPRREFTLADAKRAAAALAIREGISQDEKPNATGERQPPANKENL